MITSTSSPMLMTCCNSQLRALSCKASDTQANTSTTAMPLNTALARVWMSSLMM